MSTFLPEPAHDHSSPRRIGVLLLCLPLLAALPATTRALITPAPDASPVMRAAVEKLAACVLAVWKAGGTALMLNPMYKGKELRNIIDDSGAVGIVCLDRELDGVTETLRGSSVAWMITTSDLDFQSEDDPRVFRSPDRLERTVDDLHSILQRRSGQVPVPPPLTGDSVALLTYTSGTTGPAKGAEYTHGIFAAQVDFTHAGDLLVFVDEDLGIGQPGVVIDRSVDVLITHALAVARASAFEAVAAAPDAGKSTFLGNEIAKNDRPELTAAKVIVSGGRALGSAEKFNEIMTPLADKLGAALGASRAALRRTLLAESLRATEGLSEGFRLDVSALSLDAAIPLKSLIGQPALVEFITEQETQISRG